MESVRSIMDNWKRPIPEYNLETLEVIGNLDRETRKVRPTKGDEIFHLMIHRIVNMD